mgnify:CR=1 FL=1
MLKVNFFKQVLPGGFDHYSMTVLFLDLDMSAKDYRGAHGSRSFIFLHIIKLYRFNREQ